MLLLASCASPGEGDQYQILTGATIYDGTGAPAIEHGVILVKNDRIECVGEEGQCPSPPGAQVRDLTGSFVMPGLVDTHVHFFQTGFFDSRPDAMDVTATYPFPAVVAYQQQHPERYYRSYLCSGITGVYDVGGMSWSIDLQKQAEQREEAPHVAAAGPLITPVQGAPFDLPSDKVLVPLNKAEDGIRTVQYLSDLGSTGIKFWGFAADDESYMERVSATAEEIRKQGNKMIAHATTLEQAKAALRNGAKLLVHSVQDREVDEEFLSLARQNGTYYNPTLIVSSGYMLAYRAAAGVETYPMDDPNGCVDEKTTELLNNASQFKDHPRFTDTFMQRLREFSPAEDRLSKTMLTNLKKVYEAGLPIVVGTDAGNPGTLHGPSIYEELGAMQQAGIPAEELIVMATSNGAEAMERGDDFGTIEAGKFANIIVLAEDPAADISNMRSIAQTMIRGVIKKVEEF